MVYKLKNNMISHKMTLLRDKNTKSLSFNKIIGEITYQLIYEAMKYAETKEVEIETPLMKTTRKKLSLDIHFCPILRAGLGMLDTARTIVPNASVSFIGVARHPETKEPVTYYENISTGVEGNHIIILEPMLATGGSAIYAINQIKKHNPKKITLLSVLGAKEGVDKISNQFPDVDIYVAEVDEHMNDNKYIIPGLGDAGDRIFKTK